MFFIHVQCLLRYEFAINSMVHCGSAFELGASGLPYYCTPPVCVPDVIGALVMWQQNKTKKSLMPLPRAYTSLCTVQLCHHIINLAGPFHLLNASCTALHMHHSAQPPAPHPLAPLSTWTLVHPARSCRCLWRGRCGWSWYTRCQQHRSLWIACSHSWWWWCCHRWYNCP